MDETRSERDKRLLVALLKRTRTGDLVWKPDDEYKDLYTSATKSALLVLDSVDGDGEAPYRVAIENPSGTEIVNLTTNRYPQNSDDIEINQLLSELYKSARDQALGVNETIASLLADLEIE